MRFNWGRVPSLRIVVKSLNWDRDPRLRIAKHEVKLRQGSKFEDNCT